jgi:drug/metabolite transporter (DMT)-like permease
VKFFKNFLKSDAFVVLCLLFSMVLFGLSFMFSRLALDSVSAFTLLSWRFFTAFLLMTLLRVFGMWKINFKRMPISLFCIGLFHPILYFLFETLGISLTSVAETGIIISTVPVVSMIMASIFLKENPTRLQIIAMILSVLGAVVVVLSQSVLSPTFSLAGYLALFATVISAGLFFIVSRGVTGYSSEAKSYVMMGMGFVAFTLAALAEHARDHTVSEWLSLPFRDINFLTAMLYLGALTSVVGTWAQNFSIARLGVHRSSAFAGIATVISVLAGVLLLGEPFSLAQGCGMVMILLGVTGVNQFGQKA